MAQSLFLSLSISISISGLAQHSKPTPPPTSTDVERLFSIAGQIASDRRSDNLENFIFLRENILILNFELDWDWAAVLCFEIKLTTIACTLVKSYIYSRSQTITVFVSVCLVYSVCVSPFFRCQRNLYEASLDSGFIVQVLATDTDVWFIFAAKY